MLYSTKNFLYYTIAAYQTTSRADIAATHGQPKPPRQRAAATEGQPTSCYICETSPITRTPSPAPHVHDYTSVSQPLSLMVRCGQVTA